jgi:branched-chain amino acid transport system permease protein
MAADSSVLAPVGNAQTLPLARQKLLLLAFFLLVLGVLPFVLPNYRVFQLTLAIAYAIALLGINLLTGFNGQISLGHGAFYAIGAYAAAILMDKFAVIGLPSRWRGGVSGAGFLFGLLALRLEPLYLALPPSHSA